MCETHEAPPEVQDIARIHYGIEAGTAGTNPVGGAYLKDSTTLNPGAITFIGNITHGNICVYVPGYFEFFHETQLTVNSIFAFMPGVRVVIATHPMDYHVFYR